MIEMLAGGAHFATVGDTPLARAVVEGKHVSIITTIAVNNHANAIIARKDRGIWDASHLVGRPVGRVAWTTADFFLHVYLTTSHVNPEDVNVVDLEPSAVPTALLRGDVDAVATWQPYLTTIAQQLGTNAVILHDASLYTMTWTVAVRPDWSHLEGRAVRKFLRALLRANRFIAEQPEKARAIYGRKAGLDASALAAVWEGWTFELALDQSVILDLEDQARWILRKKGLEGSPPNFLNVIHADAFRAVSPTGVTIPGK